MWRLILSSLISLTLVTGLCLSLCAAQGPPRGKRAVQAPSEEPVRKARYPALAYAAAGLVTLIVVTIVAFPSRKETWDQRAEKRRRHRDPR
jgi:hypothetical protein